MKMPPLLTLPLLLANSLVAHYHSPLEEHLTERLQQCHRRVSAKIAPLCTTIDQWSQTASQTDLHIVKKLLRNKINMLASGVSNDMSDLQKREQQLLKQIAQTGKQLYATISKKALELNQPSPISGASKISFEAESFLAGIINLLTDWGHTSVAQELSLNTQKVDTPKTPHHHEDTSEKRTEDNPKPASVEAQELITEQQLEQTPTELATANEAVKERSEADSLEKVSAEKESLETTHEQTSIPEIGNLEQAFALSHSTEQNLPTEIETGQPNLTPTEPSLEQQKSPEVQHEAPIDDTELLKLKEQEFFQ